MKTILKKRILIPVLAATILFTGSAFKNDFFEIAKQIEIFTTLFKELNMSLGDKVTLISPVNGKAADFTISDTFNSGRYDYDANLVCIDLEKAQELFGMPNAVTGIGLKVTDEYNVRKIKHALQKTLK